MKDFHTLRVVSVDRLTPNSVALTFEVPAHLSETFRFDAGQYITIKKELGGIELRRAYSISSSPASGKLTVGIKKVANGTFSVYANESIKEGDVLEVMPPEGRFVFVGGNGPQHLAAFAAGSGITPIISIAESVLRDDDASSFVLVFGNQTAEESMYRQDLLALQEVYGARFSIVWLFSRSAEENALFGRIEPSTVNLVVKNKFKDIAFDRFFLCGPEAMIDTVSETLKKNGVADDRIRFELFTSSSDEDAMAPTLDGQTAVEVVGDDAEFSLTMDQKTLVLDAILKEGIDAPYSCQGGVCSSCIARVVEGKAEMVKNQILTDGEVAEGLILTCQAHALTPKLKIDYDDV